MDSQNQKTKINELSSLAENNSINLSKQKKTLASELELLKKNQVEILQKMSEQEEYLDYLVLQIKKIKRYIFWNYVGEVLKFLFVIVPVILAYFALKPMIGQAWDAWQNLNSSLHSINSIDTNNLNILDKFLK